LALIDPRATIVKLRRNFGQTAALAAGFAHCNGDYIIAMDGDLQHDPADIPKFLEKLEEGLRPCQRLAQTPQSTTSGLRRIPSRCANWLMATLSGVNIHDLEQPSKHTGAKCSTNYHSTARCTGLSRPCLAYGASICEIPIHNQNRKNGESALRDISHFSGIVRSHHHSISSALYVAPASLFGRLGLINMIAGSTIAFWLVAWKVIFE